MKQRCGRWAAGRSGSQATEDDFKMKFVERSAQLQNTDCKKVLINFVG